jgi:NADP-dependent 3-hydroxy acid dehydrogenase YdfG
MSLAGTPLLGAISPSKAYGYDFEVLPRLAVIVSFKSTSLLQVNNAGVGLIGPLMDLPLDSVRQLFETNVYGVIAVSQAVFPVMVKQVGGTIATLAA